MKTQMNRAEFQKHWQKIVNVWVVMNPVVHVSLLVHASLKVNMVKVRIAEVCPCPAGFKQTSRHCFCGLDNFI